MVILSEINFVDDNTSLCVEFSKNCLGKSISFRNALNFSILFVCVGVLVATDAFY